MNRPLMINLPSPMRILRAWLFRERSVRGPGAIELDVVERQVAREEQAIEAEATVAFGIEVRLDHIRQALHGALHDAATPGIVDTVEARALVRDLVGTSGVAHTRTQALEALK